MEYHIIGTRVKEYNNGEFPTKYYLHTLEYPHVISVPYKIYKDVASKLIDSLNLPHLKVTEYNGKYYYKYEPLKGSEKEE